jgi:hypothetical protein
VEAKGVKSNYFGEDLYKIKNTTISKLAKILLIINSFLKITS